MTERNEKDDFWDLSKLLPKKRPPVERFLTKQAVADVSVAGEPEKTGAARERQITAFPKETAEHGERESYVLADNIFLKEVSIFRLTDRFDFYDTFRNAALRYADYRTGRCDFIPFYSYMPQYSQLDPAQRAYYFFWRDMLRQKRYIETDQSYIQLYAYEILNLPDKIPPQEGLSLLCDVWAAYRERFPRIDHYFAATVQDYCLLYRLPCPIGRIGAFLSQILPDAPLKEFYLAAIGAQGEESAEGIASYLSDYDWRGGKFAGGEGKDTYRRFMLGALSRLFDAIREENFRIDGNTKTAILRRNAFQNSVCTLKVKCRMQIEYYPLSQALPLRRAVTASVRYIENRIRALIGVKSRLGVKDLPDRYRAVIDAYFAEQTATRERERLRAAQPAYERRYDAPREELSFLSADEIERASWSTTERLVDTGEEPDEGKVPPPAALPEKEAPAAEDPAALSAGATAFLVACMRGGQESRDEQKRIAASFGLPTDSFAEEVNSYFTEDSDFGDVVLETDDNGYYRLIEDYKGEIAVWLKTHRC